MNKRLCPFLTGLILAALAILSGPIANTLRAQDRLPHYPGYDQYQKMNRELRGEVFTPGRLTVTWTDGGKGFDYQWSGKSFHYDTTRHTLVEKLHQRRRHRTGRARRCGGRRGGRGGSSQGRRRGGNVIGGGGSIGGGGIARNLSSATTSPDGKFRAFARGNNLWISDPDGGGGEMAVTANGSAKNRIRYGIATIVYGEELGIASACGSRRTARNWPFTGLTRARFPITRLIWINPGNTTGWKWILIPKPA